jgi:hypothetical protein
MHNLLKTITILTDYGHNVFKRRSTLVNEPVYSLPTI